MKPHKGGAESQILSGWKAIANYLGAGVRCVQRYERELRLPIYRSRRKSKSRVTAIKTELDRWAKGIPVQLDDRTMRLRTQANRIGAEFPQIDAEVALTFSGLALKAYSRENRERQSDAARKAYDTIMRLRHDLDLNNTERDKLDAKLNRLKSELRRLDETS